MVHSTVLVLKDIQEMARIVQVRMIYHAKIYYSPHPISRILIVTAAGNLTYENLTDLGCVRLRSIRNKNNWNNAS